MTRIRTVFLVALAGAALVDLLLFASIQVYTTWGYGRPDNSIKSAFGLLTGFFVFVAQIFSQDTGSLIRLYLINGILGAVFFGLGAILWQIGTWGSTSRQDVRH
jgi:hypothetical protein